MRVEFTPRSSAVYLCSRDRVVLPGGGRDSCCVSDRCATRFWTRSVRDGVKEEPLLGICGRHADACFRGAKKRGVVASAVPGKVSFFGNELYDGEVRLEVPHMAGIR